MSEVRIGSFGFEYDAERKEMYVNQYFDAVAMEGEAAACIEHVSREAWEEFSSMLLERAIRSRFDEKTYTVSAALVLQVLDKLRLAHVYALKDAQPEALGLDFRPHKWEGLEGTREWAQECSELHRSLLDELLPQTEGGES